MSLNVKKQFKFLSKITWIFDLIQVLHLTLVLSNYFHMTDDKLKHIWALYLSREVDITLQNKILKQIKPRIFTYDCFKKCHPKKQTPDDKCTRKQLTYRGVSMIQQYLSVYPTLRYRYLSIIFLNIYMASTIIVNNLFHNLLCDNRCSLYHIYTV